MRFMVAPVVRKLKVRIAYRTYENHEFDQNFYDSYTQGTKWSSFISQKGGIHRSLAAVRRIPDEQSRQLY
jgi:hypothetical protein